MNMESIFGTRIHVCVYIILHIYIQTQALTHSIRSLQSFKWLRCNAVFIHSEFVLYVCLHFGLLISLDASKRVFTGIKAVFLCALSCFTVDGALANQRKWMHSSLCAISLSLSIFPVSVSHLQSREPRISNEKCTNFNESFMNILRCTFFRIFTKCQIARNRQMFFTIDKCNSRFISTLFLLLSIFFVLVQSFRRWFVYGVHILLVYLKWIRLWASTCLVVW